MAAKVYNLDGTPYHSLSDLIKDVAGSDDLKSVVVVLQRIDGTFDVWYNRQTIQDVIVSNAILSKVASRMVEDMIPDEK